MLIQVLGGYGGESDLCRMTCLLINGTIALDAGSLSQVLSIERQVGVHSIVLSHSHMDHTNSLPFFIENVFGKLREALREAPERGWLVVDMKQDWNVVFSPEQR